MTVPASSTPYSFIHLASHSPRRRELLRQIEVRFETLLLRSGPGREPDVVERPGPDEAAADYVLRIAREKGRAGRRRAGPPRLPPAPVLGADTEVVLDGEIFGKPVDATDAVRMLGRLSARSHQVISAVALATPDGGLVTRLSASDVEFRPLAPGEADRYARSGEPMGKAGGYAIQGRGAVFVRRINGSYSGVMGLPLFETAELLACAGVAVG
jgi:septum formation protein